MRDRQTETETLRQGATLVIIPGDPSEKKTGKYQKYLVGYGGNEGWGEVG